MITRRLVKTAASDALAAKPSTLLQVPHDALEIVDFAALSGFCQ